MRKALIVGIDYYEQLNSLNGCVNDSYSMTNALSRNGDGTKNFEINHIPVTNDATKITKRELKDNIKELFVDASEIALFYFSGHGSIEDDQGYILTSDAEEIDDGVSLDDILKYINESPARNRLLILDSCFSGSAGSISSISSSSYLSEGVTILTSSSASQYSVEENAQGLFSSLFIDALNGSAANLVGDITPASIYAHIDQSLGAWQQRPIFKTNTKNFISLKKVNSLISLSDLRTLTSLFTSPSVEFELDPTFEPKRDNIQLSEKIPPPIEGNVAKFRILQALNRVGLVIPIGESHMYYAAMNSKSCKLTALGEHYWNLVNKDRI